MGKGILTPRRAADPNNQTNGKWCRGGATEEYPGGTCGNYPVRGGTVCAQRHGGKASHIRNKANLRLVKEKALIEANKMLEEDNETGDAVNHLLKRLAHASKMVQLYGALVAGLWEEGEEAVASGSESRRGWAYKRWIAGDGVSKGHYETHVDPILAAGRDKFHLHPLVEEFDAWCERHARFAKLAIDAHVDERRISLAEDTAGRLLALLEASWDRLGLTADQKQLERRHIAKDLMRDAG